MEEVVDHRDDQGEEDARLSRRGRGQLPAAVHTVVVVPIPPPSSSSSSSPSSTIIFPNNNTTTTTAAAITSRRWAQQSKKGGGGSVGGRCRNNNGHRVVTYIRKMNVVNNFGSGNNCDGRKEKKPVVVAVVAAAWERTCRPMALLRIASVLLAILWLLALAAVMTTTGGSSLPHGPQRVVALKMPEVELAAAVAAAARASSAAEEEEEEAVVVPRPHSIFELSLLGSKSPNDFQQYSPPPRAGDPMSSYSSCDVPLDPDDVSYTLVSQLSDDRIWMIRHHCLRWGTGNPMSIVVFTDRTMDDVMNELASSSSSSSDAGGSDSGSGSGGCSAEHLTLQVVQKTTYDPGGTEYPVNLLRNLAFSAVRTSHAVYADVDFWPSRDLHSILSNVTVRERLASDGRLAAVIPAFQMNRRCREYADCRERNIPSMPSNREELIRQLTLQKGAVSAFDPTNRGGHGSTRYNAWVDQEDGTFVDLGCVKSNRYEPYLAIRRCAEMPPFQEGFTGYGKNKMTVSTS